MRGLVLISFIVFFVVSCKKFEHEKLEVPNCELCEYASTLSGDFRGYASGIAVPNYGDSMSINLEQIFVGNSQYEDSTFMHFRVTYTFDSEASVYEKMVRLENFSGVFEETIYAGNGTFIASPDSLRVNNSGSNGVSTSPYIFGTFYRQ